ncbi:uncharacterized protein LOC103174893 [Callorhinchus milii]|uniref:uncharacterized protein LOC103174893 n=1 Tax=Callorhinchus milii TaxID=7868 RepID=UPI001C3F9ADE|nr:uncharacterized protein LOC103174893 [Callorhinchus milii]
MTLRTSPAECLVNEDVSLQCEIADLTGITLDKNHLGVLWSFTDDIFKYINGALFKLGKGVELLESSILKGNMSLLLKNVTMKQMGEYKCTVFVPPNEQATGTVRLEVLARPSVIVVSEETVEFGLGGEMTLDCQLNGFYPCEASAEWFQKMRQGEKKQLTDICISQRVIDTDGLCNMSIQVRLLPVKEDIGSTFECEAKHKTFKKPFSVEAHVTLKEAEIRISQGSVVASIVMSIIFTVAAIIFGIYAYMKYFYKVPPKISGIKIPARIVHRELAELMCHVSGFQPEAISIFWYLKNMKEGQNKLIGQYVKSQMQSLPFGGKKNKNPDSEIAIYENLHQWEVKTANVYKNKDGTFSLSSILCIFPDINEHNQAKIMCEVIHPSGKGVIKTLSLDVTGIPPKLDEIIQPPIVLHNNSVMLTCPINFFKPSHLVIKWYKIKDDGEKRPIVKCINGVDESWCAAEFSHSLSEFSYPDHTQSVRSMLLFNATIEETENSQYFCEVQHIALQNPVEKFVKLQVKAFPILNTIVSDPPNSVVGEKLTLSCKVHSFYPKEIVVRWFKDKDLIETDEVLKITQGSLEKNVFELTSQYAFTVSLLDLKCVYKCEVNHESLMYPRVEEYIPENLVAFPKVSEVLSDPSIPEIGKELTLTCTIKEFYPKDIQVEWFRDNVAMEMNGKYGTITKESSSEYGLNCIVTTVTLTPTTDDHQAKYTVEICHSKSSTKPYRHTYQLLIKGSPRFSEFVLEPKILKFGKHLTVSQTMNGLCHKDFSIEWYKGDNRVTEGVVNSSLTQELQNTYSMISCLKFLLTADDFEKDLIFHYKENNKTDVFKRRCHLPLKRVPPKVSEIIHKPDRPKIGETLTLSCTVDDFCPGDIAILWSKGWTDFAEEQFVQVPRIGENGLYSTFTQLEVELKPDDEPEEFSCEIRHAKTNDVVEKFTSLLV